MVRTGQFTFDKRSFKLDSEIKELYKKKLEISEEKQGKDLPPEVRKAYVTDDMFGAFLKLERAGKLDPRYRNIYFRDKETAKKALEVANKLDNMEDEEFLYSGYPYVWQDEIKLSKLILI